ncbi:TPA: LAGLIDADG family homing endonuclease [Clostridium perfringens]
MHKYICEKCSKEFLTRKKEQRFCSKSCANSHNTTLRKIEDLSIFDKGINEISAYILGLIISDGCLSYDKHCKRFKITITSTDLEIIKFLNKSYCLNKKIYEYKSKKFKNAKISYSFITTNKYDVDFIHKIGITERKSKDVFLLNVEESFIGDFIRGIFDGDGSVYINTTKNKLSNGDIKEYKYLNVSISTGSINMAKQLSNLLNQKSIKAKIVKDSRKFHECWYVKIYEKNSILNLYKLMYTNAKLYMHRKKNVFNMMI